MSGHTHSHTDAHDHRHDHREPTGNKLAQAARAMLESKGEQWTDMRGDIFAVLAAEEKPSSAYDIADKVSQRRGKRVAPNSVYRILDLFVANNLAQRVESANAYVVNAHPACRHDCMFLICDQCGAVDHIDDDRATNTLRTAAIEAGFQPARPIIEMRGLCPACAKAA